MVATEPADFPSQKATPLLVDEHIHNHKYRIHSKDMDGVLSNQRQDTKSIVKYVLVNIFTR
jgi:hypothetical protein